jgi:hypothetical protein
MLMRVVLLALAAALLIPTPGAAKPAACTAIVFLPAGCGMDCPERKAANMTLQSIEGARTLPVFVNEEEPGFLPADLVARNVGNVFIYRSDRPAEAYHLSPSALAAVEVGNEPAPGEDWMAMLEQLSPPPADVGLLREVAGSLVPRFRRGRDTGVEAYFRQSVEDLEAANAARSEPRPTVVEGSSQGWTQRRIAPDVVRIAVEESGRGAASGLGVVGGEIRRVRREGANRVYTVEIKPGATLYIAHGKELTVLRPGDMRPQN